jgi:hypothetical protein
MVGSLTVAEPADWPLLEDLYSFRGCGVLWKPVDFVEARNLIRTADQAARDRAYILRGQMRELGAPK